MVSDAIAIIVGAGIAATTTFGLVIVGRNQTRIMGNNLRLELYNRRFAIYDALSKLRLILARLDFDPVEAEILLREFLFKAREASFLFDASDNILTTLENMRMPAQQVILSHRKFANMPQIDRMREAIHLQGSLQDLRVMSDALEVRLMPYLDFRSIEGESVSMRMSRSASMRFLRDYFWG